MKLKPVVTCNSILQIAFAPISICPKITNPNCDQIKAMLISFVWKMLLVKKLTTLSPVVNFTNIYKQLLHFIPFDKKYKQKLKEQKSNDYKLCMKNASRKMLMKSRPDKSSSDFRRRWGVDRPIGIWLVRLFQDIEFASDIPRSTSACRKGFWRR